jgi:hypothetical protein
MNYLELQKKVIQKSTNDNKFREEFLTDPKKTVEKTFGFKLPDGMKVKAEEENSDTITFIIPKNSGELSEGELENVAGGCGFHWCPYDFDVF